MFFHNRWIQSWSRLSNSSNRSSMLLSFQSGVRTSFGKRINLSKHAEQWEQFAQHGRSAAGGAGGDFQESLRARVVRPMRGQVGMRPSGNTTCQDQS